MSENTDKSLGVLALVALGALFLLPAAGMGVGMGSVGHMGGVGHAGGAWGGTTSWWAMAISVIVQLAVLAALVGAAYLAYRHLGDSQGGDTAIEELRRAYARGDLTDDEFERRRERLRE